MWCSRSILLACRAAFHRQQLPWERWLSVLNQSTDTNMVRSNANVVPLGLALAVGDVFASTFLGENMDWGIRCVPVYESMHYSTSMVG